MCTINVCADVIILPFSFAQIQWTAVGVDVSQYIPSNFSFLCAECLTVEVVVATVGGEPSLTVIRTFAEETRLPLDTRTLQNNKIRN